MRLLRPAAASRLLWNRLTAPAGLAALNGLLAGTYLLVWLQQFAGAFGTGLAASSAIALTIGTAAAIGTRRRQSHGHAAAATPLFGSFALIHLALAAWTVCSGWLIDGLFAMAARVPLPLLATPHAQLAFHLAAAAIVLGLPVALLSQLSTCCSSSASGTGPQHLPMESIAGNDAFAFASGIGFGLLLNVFIVAPSLGLHWIATGAVLIGCAVFLGSVIRRSSNEQPGCSEQPGFLPPVADSNNDRVCTVGPANRFFEPSVVFVVGISVAALLRLIGQLMPASSWLSAVEWGSLLLIGPSALLISTTSWRASRLSVSENGNRHAGRSIRCLLLAIWLVGVPAAYPALVHLALMLNACVSLPWLLELLRGTLAGLILLPAGIAWGTCSSPGRNVSQQFRSRGAAQFHPLPFACGYVLAKCLLSSGIGVDSLLIASAAAMLLASLLQTLRLRPLPTGWRGGLTLAASIAPLLLAPLAIEQYRPDIAAKTLFNTASFVAYRSGVAFRHLRYLDDARCLSIREGANGTLTLWKQRGLQWQLRESGVPKGMVSANGRLHPGYSGETLRAVLPLVLHQQPSRVLLLGVRSTAALRDCAAFPVRDITCVEPDRGLLRLLHATVAADRAGDPFADDRVAVVNTTAELAVAARTEPFDVVISQPDQSSLLQSTAAHTAEFYRRAAKQLSPQGIFCQPFPFIDYGPDAILTAVRTVQSAFRTAIVVETAPGELLLIATNGDRGIVRDGLVERLQAPHVRHLLGRIGWDYSVLLGLPAYSDESLRTLTQSASSGTNTMANARFAFHLPREMMRWADKGTEVRTVMAPHAARLLEWSADEETQAEISRRMADVNTQHRLAHDFPDQWWAYRKTVREQLTGNPRSKIQQVGGEGLKNALHPEDRRRLRYFEVLGDAAQAADAESIERLTRFEEPYDPLISHFLHYEAAKLYARADERNVQAELAHRLHAIHFASIYDRSVRDVAEALELLVEHPETVPAAVDRWDHLNGLLQVMQGRWEARRRESPKSSRIMLNDLDQSIAAVEAVLLDMDALLPDAGLSHPDWQIRRDLLDRGLLQPLRGYRRQVMSQHVNSRRQTEQLLERAAPDAQ